MLRRLFKSSTYGESNIQDGLALSKFYYFRQFLKHPTVTGAISSSSKGLANQMVNWLDFDKIKTIVEIGPGTGVFSHAIIESMNEDTLYFSVEIDAHMVQAFRKRFPDQIIYHDTVENIHQYLAEHGIDNVDAIICSLPWAAFNKEKQDKILADTAKLLNPGGLFASFGYIHGLAMPSGMRFRRKLRGTFTNISHSKIVWKNLPSAFVYRCVK